MATVAPSTGASSPPLDLRRSFCRSALPRATASLRRRGTRVFSPPPVFTGWNCRSAPLCRRRLAFCFSSSPSPPSALPEALLFDCDGVLVDTEKDGHRISFNEAFTERELGVTWDVDLYGELLKIGGGKERMTAYFNQTGWPEKAPKTEEERKDFIASLHKRKTELFMALIEKRLLPLRPGVERIIDEALAKGVKVAVCSTSNEKAVSAIVSFLLGPERADKITIFAGDVVPRKKPDPMASGSGSGDQPPRRTVFHTFRSRKSRATSGSGTPTTTAPATTSHTPVAATSPPAAVTTSVPVYHSPDPHIPPGHPYSTFPAPPPAYPYPPHAYYPPAPYYSTFTPYPATHSDAPPPTVPPPTVPPPMIGSSHDTRQYIEPEGDTFNPPKQATHKIRDLIRSNFEAPYLSWKKIPQGVRDMWFREFQRDFYWQPQYADRIRRNFEHRGSVRMRDMFTDIRKSGTRPHWIGERVWGDLCAAWESPAYAKKREQNKQNRASDCGGAGSSLHTGGARPHTEYRRQLAASLGREPTMSELHTQTHQRRDTHEWVDARAQQASEEYARLREQQSQTSAGEGSSSGASSYPQTDFDLWTQAVGGKKKGRTYGLGSQGPAFDAQSTHTSPSDYTGRSFHDMMLAQERMQQQILQQQQQIQDQHLQQQQYNQQMQQQMQEMMRLLQQHVPPPPQPPQSPQHDDDADA